MHRVPKLGYWMLLSCGVLFPIGLAAQSSPPRALNEQQKMGKGLFMQNCQLCHLPEKQNMKNTKEEGETIGPRLDVLMKGPKPLSDAVLRTFIMNGSEGKMPTFKYALEPKEVAAIIAYVKTM